MLNHSEEPQLMAGLGRQTVTSTEKPCPGYKLADKRLEAFTGLGKKVSHLVCPQHDTEDEAASQVPGAP